MAWAIAGLLLMISELFLPGLILFFFGIGALMTALLCRLIPLSIGWQLISFSALSLGALLGLRRLLKPIFTGSSSAARDGQTNPLIGACGEVQQPIEPGKVGRVLLHGASWKAISDEAIAAGTSVKVTEQNNLTLTVTTTQ